MNWAARFAACWPRGKFSPVVGAGFVGVDGRNLVLGIIVLKIFRQERSQDVLAEIGASVAAELNGAERIGVFNFLSVMPRTHHQKNFVVVGVFGLDSFVYGHRA